MENPVWNLAAKAASALACFLLLAGTLLASAAYWKMIDTELPGVVTIFVAAGIAIFALTVSQLQNSRLARQEKAAVEVANLLTQGRLPAGEPDTELLDSLHGVADYIREKIKITNHIAQGRLNDTYAPLSDGDELGRAIQNMAAGLRDSVQTKETRDRLHDSVMKLLDEVSGVSNGDLTVHADVSPEITGAIAEAFNSMTENLRRLIRQVKDITSQVGTSAESINDTTERLAKGSVVQTSQITRTTSAIAKMAAQIQEVSLNAETSSKVAFDSLNRARSGTKAAADNINAMRCVRKQVQETTKRVKRLGERSQEIGQIVALINDLSDRTSLLALNASLQASAAGQAGAAFAAVAEEVERLAERSNRLTGQISTLTQTINTETKDVVASMEDTIREVVVGSALADKAGQALFSIETTSIKLADLLKSISESASYQARSSEDISAAMASISEVTEVVESGSKQAAGSVRSLVKLSDELQNSVSPFKLPADTIPAAADTTHRDMFVH